MRASVPLSGFLNLSAVS